ncbi:hypothetical protein [Streptomyces sp. NPDC046371]
MRERLRNSMLVPEPPAQACGVAAALNERFIAPQAQKTVARAR